MYRLRWNHSIHRRCAGASRLDWRVQWWYVRENVPFCPSLFFFSHRRKFFSPQVQTFEYRQSMDQSQRCEKSSCILVLSFFSWYYQTCSPQTRVAGRWHASWHHLENQDSGRRTDHPPGEYQNQYRTLVWLKKFNLQLQTAAGSAIKHFHNAKGVNVPRSRFLPVKNCSDLLRIKSDLFVLEHGRLVMNQDRLFGNMPVIKLGGHFKKVDR